MARIQLGALITDIRGKLGGHVFKQNNGGLTIQTKAGKGQNFNGNPVAKKNKAELIDAIAKGWRALNDTDKLAFDSYSELLNGEAAAKKNKIDVKKGFGIASIRGYSGYSFTWSYNAIFGETIPSSFLIQPIAIDKFPGATIETNGTVLRVVNPNSYTQAFKLVVRASKPLTGNTKTNLSKSTTLLKQFPNALVNLDITQEYLNAFGQLPTAGQFVIVETDTYLETQGREAKETIKQLLIVGTY